MAWIEEQEIEHGVTIVATGAYETREHPLLALPGVITQRELEEKIIHQPEAIMALRDVVMIQCMRPPGTPDYCSRVCCTNTIKNAIRLKLFNPNCRVSVLYKNIVTYGFREEYYTQARAHGVVFVRYTDEEPPEVSADGDRLCRPRARSDAESLAESARRSGADQHVDCPRRGHAMNWPRCCAFRCRARAFSKKRR